MAKSSIHIETGHRGNIAHNSRENFSKSQVFFDEENDLLHNSKEAFKMLDYEVAKRAKVYQDRTGQKLQKKTSTQLSVIVNLNSHHVLNDLNPLKNYLEKKLDTKIIQVSIHRDEGKLVHKESDKILTSGEHFFANPKDRKLYFDQEYTQLINMEEWEISKNYHAHFEMIGINSEGGSIRRAMNTRLLRDFQDFTAKSLGMERGEKTSPNYNKSQMTEIKKNLLPRKEYENEKAYIQAFKSVAKELGYYKAPKKKRKSTHAYKRDMAVANETRGLNSKIEQIIEANTPDEDGLLPDLSPSPQMYEMMLEYAEESAKATKDELSEEIENLREKLKKQKSKRPEYAKLEQLSNDLKAQLADKDLTILTLKKEVGELEKELIANTKYFEKELEEVKESFTYKLKEQDGLIEDMSITIEEQAEELEKAHASIKEMSNLLNDMKNGKDILVTNVAKYIKLITVDMEATEGKVMDLFQKVPSVVEITRARYQLKDELAEKGLEEVEVESNTKTKTETIDP